MKLFPNRLYKSGSKWAFWRWTSVPTGYINRLHFVHTPIGSICIHWLNHEDPEPHLHNHPVNFLSLILPGGGYYELRKDGCYRRFWFNYIRAKDFHKIISVLPRTVTVCFMSPKIQDWGFQTSEGFVPWKEYNKRYK